MSGSPCNTWKRNSQQSFRVLGQYRAAVSLWYHRGGLKLMIPGIRARLGTSLRTPRHYETQPPSHPPPCTLMTDSQSESDTHTHTFYITKLHDLSSAFTEHYRDTNDVLHWNTAMSPTVTCHLIIMENPLLWKPENWVKTRYCILRKRS